MHISGQRKAVLRFNEETGALCESLHEYRYIAINNMQSSMQRPSLYKRACTDTRALSLPYTKLKRSVVVNEATLAACHVPTLPDETL